MPAAAVARVERVEIDETAEAVERPAVGARAEAVDRPAEVVQRPVDVVVAPVRPVGLDRQHSGRATPVRETQVPRALEPARLDAEVRELPLPRLNDPVGTVRRRTADDEPVEPRSRVASAAIAEGPPVGAVVLAPAAGVVDPETALVGTPDRRDGVDRTPREHVLDRAADAIGE